MLEVVFQLVAPLAESEPPSKAPHSSTVEADRRRVQGQQHQQRRLCSQLRAAVTPPASCSGVAPTRVGAAPVANAS